MYTRIVKPFLDIFAAIIGLIIASPLLLICSIGLYFANQGKPFFFQLRPGKNGKTFHIVKFRTMNNKKDSAGNLLPDKERLTNLGRFIRRTSLDEIPQFLNVLMGDMSLVGPRPLLTNYLHLYNDLQKRRHEVKPGITGWAQINGRNAISWNEKFEYDVWYVNHISFILDVKILFKTILKVIKSDGINAVGAATIEPFNGK